MSPRWWWLPSAWRWPWQRSAEAPRPPSGSPTTTLAGLLGDVRAATAFRYDAHDSLGNRMDTAKVIASPAGG